MCLARRVRVRAPHMPRLNVPLWRMCGGLAGGHRRIGSGGFSALSSARGPMRMCFMSLLDRARDVCLLLVGCWFLVGCCFVVD